VPALQTASKETSATHFLKESNDFQVLTQNRKGITSDSVILGIHIAARRYAQAQKHDLHSISLIPKAEESLPRPPRCGGALGGVTKHCFTNSQLALVETSCHANFSEAFFNVQLGKQCDGEFHIAAQRYTMQQKLANINCHSENSFHGRASECCEQASFRESHAADGRHA
jgi:hypothetical protein